MSHAGVNLEEQMKLLVELQGLDSQIYKLRRELDSIPEEIKLIEEELKEKTASLKKAEDELKAFILKRKEKELDLESKEGQIKKQQGQLYQIKTNKEYAALDGEISRIKADNSIIEEEILRIFDLIDAQNQKIAKEKELLKDEETKSSAEKKKCSDESKRLEEELGVLKVQRETHSGKVDKNILGRYERILGGKDGLAVVSIVKSACQGCYRMLPSQVINEIQMKQDIVLCEHCQRMLYLED